MEQVAELGYFIIKYIENFELTLTVGVSHEGHHQMWFIPDDERDDYEITPERLPKQYQRIRDNALRRSNEHEIDL